MNITSTADLPGSDRAKLFEGGDHGGVSLTFFVITYREPGIGPDLHRHPYDETWLVQKGRVLLRIGEEEVEAGPGDIASTPANTPHKFTSLEPAELVCIHASPRLIQEELE